MKTTFSTSWKESLQPRKQRKYRHNAPLHVKHKFLSAQLSEELRKKHGIRSIPVRSGDEVNIMRGTFAGKKAKVIKVQTNKSRVTLENITRKKADGTKLNVYFNPSKLQIIALKLDDSRRLPSGKTGGTKKSEEKNNAPNQK
ncbi:50S ribosomal protein L24 [Candidatus Pacearchaeota archaeon]|nr:50S ribosomal protein L24 [Candidatus Pacearchaeota archaeon]